MHPQYGPEHEFQDEVDKLIDRINMKHLFELRIVRGKDLNDHFLYLNELASGKRYDEALILLEEIIDVTHQLPQYDTREPQPYWPMKAASYYLKLKRPEEAMRVLARWLSAWPEDRGRQTERARVRARLTKIMNMNI